jgi:GTP-binding protein EngB required for normal cell division
MKQTFDNSLTFLVFGPTQAGKSSFVNAIESEEEAATGTGISTTKSCKSYKVNFPELAEHLRVLDVPGIYDTALMTNSKIRENIVLCTMESAEKPYIDGILCFESLSADSVQIQRTLKQLTMNLGQAALQSVTFVLTKDDKLSEEEKGLRLESIQEELSRNFSWVHIKWVVWSNMATGSKMAEQRQELATVLKESVPYQLEEIEKLKQRIEELATKLQKEDEGKRKKNVTIRYEHQVVDAKKEMVNKIRPKIDFVDMVRMVDRFKINTEERQAPRSIIDKVLNTEAFKYYTQNVEVYQIPEKYREPKISEEKYQEEEEKYYPRTEEKESTQTFDQDPFPIEHYRELAKKQILQEYRDKCISSKKMSKSNK